MSVIENIELKGGYFYSSPTTADADENSKRKEDEVPEVQFNLLIIFGKSPTVQILPDSYTAEHVRSRMEGEKYVYLRASYDHEFNDLSRIKTLSESKGQ